MDGRAATITGNQVELAAAYFIHFQNNSIILLFSFGHLTERANAERDGKPQKKEIVRLSFPPPPPTITTKPRSPLKVRNEHSFEYFMKLYKNF